MSTDCLHKDAYEKGRTFAEATNPGMEGAEAIYQMGLCGGMPAMFNALNAAMDVFDRAEGLQ